MDIYVQKDGQQLGPFSEVKIRAGIDAGEFAPDDHAWTSGKASWQPISALISLDVNRPPPFSESTNDTAVEHDLVKPPPFEISSFGDQIRQDRHAVTIAIEDDSFSINGVTISIPTDANPLNQFLGTPRWRSPHQYFWDDWGILAWGEDRKSLSSFTIYLHRSPFFGQEYSVKQPFTGKLTIGGVVVTAETRIEDVVANKRGLSLVENMTDSWNNVKHTLFKDFFGLYKPSIGLTTTHQDTISSLWFSQRRKRAS